MSDTATAREKLDHTLGMARRVLAFWKRALVVFIVTCLVAVPFSLTRPRTYKSETVILYQDTMTARLSADGSAGTSEQARRVGARLREVLLSRASLEPIIKEIHVYDALVEKRGMVDAVEEMRKQITFRAREGDTFEISYQGSSPDEVQEVTRRLGDCIVREASSRRAEEARALKAFVDAESERNQKDLREKEGALASFLAENPEFARMAAAEAQGGAAQAPGPVATTPGPVSTDPQLAALEANAWKIERQLAAAATAGTRAPPPPPPPRAESPELQAARRDLADKLAKYTDKHPDVAAARARLRAAEEAEAAAAKTAAPPPAPPPEEPSPALTPTERDALRQQLATLQAQIAARRHALAAAKTGKADASAGPATATAPQDASIARAVEYRRLAREVADARERQRQLDDKQFKAAISANSANDDRSIQVTVLDPAYRPTHAISRPRSLLLAIALIACFGIALATAFASALFDDRIHGRADLERLDVLPVVGVIPRATSLVPSRADRPPR